MLSTFQCISSTAIILLNTLYIISAASNFRGLERMTYWLILLIAVLMHHDPDKEEKGMQICDFFLFNYTMWNLLETPHRNLKYHQYCFSSKPPLCFAYSYVLNLSNIHGLINIFSFSAHCLNCQNSQVSKRYSNYRFLFFLLSWIVCLFFPG